VSIAIERFFAEVDAFSGGRSQEDDQTMVVLRAADTVPVGDVSSVGWWAKVFARRLGLCLLHPPAPIGSPGPTALLARDFASM